MFRRSFPQRPVIQSFLIRSHPPADQAGFVLPLSVSAALVLMLSSLSLSAAALQAHRQHGANRTRQQAEDQLTSAAHQRAAELQGPFRCLLNVPSVHWQVAANSPSCPAGMDPRPLLGESETNQSVMLRGWAPDGSGGGGELWLQLGEHGLQKRYALKLEPGEGLRELG